MPAISVLLTVLFRLESSAPITGPGLLLGLVVIQLITAMCGLFAFHALKMGSRGILATALLSNVLVLTSASLIFRVETIMSRYRIALSVFLVCSFVSMVTLAFAAIPRRTA